MDMMFSEDPGLHRQICPEGAALAWVEADKRSLKLSSPVATPEVSGNFIDPTRGMLLNRVPYSGLRRAISS